MPAPLNQDAVAYLKQQGLPVTTQSLNRTMGLLNQQPNLRPSYAGQGTMDIDVETMRPTIQSSPLPPLQSQSNTGGSFGQTFKAARKQLGAGKTFDWNGKKYTTDYKEEVGQQSNSPQQSSGDNIAEDSSVNPYAEAEMQEDLAMEKAGVDDIEQRQAADRGRGSLNRGNYSQVAQEDDGMENLLAAVLGGGAVAGGAALLGKKGQQHPRMMQQGDLNAPDKVSDAMTDEDLYGKKPQQMQKGDLGFVDKQLNEMVDADLYGKPATDSDYLNKVLEGADWVDEEKRAAKLMLAGNKKEAQKLLPRLKNLGADKKLMSIIKGMM